MHTNLLTVTRVVGKFMTFRCRLNQHWHPVRKFAPRRQGLQRAARRIDVESLRTHAEQQQQVAVTGTLQPVTSGQTLCGSRSPDEAKTNES